MGEDWSKTERSKSLPDLVDLIEETRRERAGPPRDPWTVAYPHVLALARDILWREIKNERRRDAILEEFRSWVARIEGHLENRETFGDQILAVEQIIADSEFSGLDLRTRREGKAPEPQVLLDEYTKIHQRVLEIFQPRAKGRRKQLKQRLQFAERLQIEFPFLTPEQASNAAHDKPSWGAFTVVGARYGLSPERIRNLLAKAR